MALSDRGLAVVFPEVQGRDLSQSIDKFFAVQRQQKALELQQYKLMREQEDKNAEFLADMIKQNRALTGTPYDEILNGKLNEIWRANSEKIAKNPGMSQADISMNIARDISDLALFKQRTLEIKAAVDAQVEAFGGNKNKMRALLYNRVFRNPDGQFKRGSDLTPELVEEEFDNLTYEHPEYVYNSTEGLEKYVKGFETETMDGRRKTINSRKGYTAEQVTVKLPKGLYEIRKGGIDENGIVDSDKIDFIPKTKEEILSDERLRSGKLLAYRELLARGEVPTKEKILKILPDVVNKFIQQRAPLSVTKKEEVKAAPITNVTVNNPAGPAQSKPDVFTSIVEEQPWIMGKLPTSVNPITGKEYYNVTAALPGPAKLNNDSERNYKGIFVDKKTKDIRAVTDKGEEQEFAYGTPEWSAFSSAMQGQTPFERLSSQYEPGKKPAKYKQTPFTVKKPKPVFNPLAPLNR